MLMRAVVAVAGLAIMAFLNLFNKDGLFPVEPPFKSDLLATRQGTALEIRIDAGNQDAELELDAMSFATNSTQFSAALDNGQRLDVVATQRAHTPIWHLAIFRADGAHTKTQFLWPSNTAVVLHDGTARALTMFDWTLYTAKNVSDSSDRVQTHNTRRLWIGLGSAVALLVGIATVIFREDKPPSAQPIESIVLFDLMIARVQRQLLGPNRTEFIGDERIRVTLGTEVLRKIVLENQTEQEALADFSQPERTVAQVGYSQLRTKFMNQLREMLVAVTTCLSRAQRPRATHNVGQA